MESDRPRLLVALRPQDGTRATLNQVLPDVPWGFLEGTPVDRWSAVEAMLVGSFAGEFAQFDARATPRLQFVQRVYTGLDGFPFDRFPESVKVAGNVGAFGPFVAEHAVALALAAARDMYRAREMVAEGRLRPPPEERSLYEATAVILGYGEIGREIARRLTGFGTRVVGVNRTGSPVPGCDTMFAADHLDAALPLGAFVFEARPLTRATAGSLGKSQFERMRPEAVFVNVGRAGTVNEEALFRHLESHPAFRAAIDVWWEEDFAHGKLPSRFPFARLPNFVGTPHSAGAIAAAQPRAFRYALDNLARFFREGRPLHVVDRREYTE